MKTVRDPDTADMFSLQPAASFERSRIDVCRLVSSLLAGRDRLAVAIAMSELLDHQVSKHMLDAWASPRREAHNLPLYEAPALEAACDSHLLTDWMAELRGGRAAYGTEAAEAQIGQALASMEREREQLSRSIRAARQKLGTFE